MAAPSNRGILTGAAFLMAVSAIGPGFLTQTTQFTAELGASLAFAILLSTIIDIGAQLTTWRVICVSRQRGQEIANVVLPGFGHVVTAVILVGSLFFNIGNLGGCALGLETLLNLPQAWGIVVSAALAVGLFLLPAMLKGVDWVAKVLGAGMIVVTLYVVVSTAPPLGEALLRAVAPETINVDRIVTLIGGTIGGYIMFSGAHRLLDGGVAGPEQLAAVTEASVRGILIAGAMRFVLFLAVLGVVARGATLDRDRPVFDAFQQGAGDFGYYLSGLVFWSAAITSVIGAAYTSVSFLPVQDRPRRRTGLIVAFILLSTALTLGLRWFGWQPTPLLIAAGRVNGLLLPIVFGVVLLAAYRRDLMGSYRHPLWAGCFGAVALAATVFMAGWSIWTMLPR
ncbi:MAG: divalent metal cation transporter [Gemmataceae bacterium]|nr:divalent metal cation transporter [Gemmataceae bacterium]